MPDANVSKASKSIADSDSDDDEVEKLNYKVVILGDGAVGKSSIIDRFCNDYHGPQYKQTIGLDFYSKQVVLPGDLQVSLQIWDIGGQNIGSQMIQKYIYGAHAVLLCYDITNYQSFQNLEDWLVLVTKTFQERTMPYIALVGNKLDLLHMRAVKPEKHNFFADESNMYSYFVSAKQGDKVASTFYRIAADLAGVVLTDSEVEGSMKVLPANIVNHQQHDPATPQLVLKQNDDKCSLQ